MEIIVFHLLTRIQLPWPSFSCCSVQCLKVLCYVFLYFLIHFGVACVLCYVDHPPVSFWSLSWCGFSKLLLNIITFINYCFVLFSLDLKTNLWQTARNQTFLQLLSPFMTVTLLTWFVVVLLLAPNHSNRRVVRSGHWTVPTGTRQPGHWRKLCHSAHPRSVRGGLSEEIRVTVVGWELLQSCYCKSLTNFAMSLLTLDCDRN